MRCVIVVFPDHTHLLLDAIIDLIELRGLCSGSLRKGTTYTSQDQMRLHLKC